MTIKKQTKTKKEKKEQTVVQPSHKNESYLRHAYLKEGKSAGEIGRELGVSRAAILFQMKTFGIDVSKTRKTKSADAKVIT